MVKDIAEIGECPDCASLEIVHNSRLQQVVCKSCGLIYEPLTPRDEQNYLHPVPSAHAPRASDSASGAGRKASQKKKRR